jgi:uncharacterized protein YigE (DUF2233 family)
MRHLHLILLALACGVLAAEPAAYAQGRRVALVIGNAAYRHTPRLTNPANDAADVAAALQKRGFRVISGRDLDKAAFDRKVREFAAGLKGAEAGLFFYAGHGLQVGGQNYLVPVDAKAQGTATLDLEMVKVDAVQHVMQAQIGVSILLLDACRDNPLARTLARSVGTRSSGVAHGLAPITTGAAGTLIGFSTAPGNVALDGTGRNSPYAGAFVRQMSTTSQELGAMLIAVRRDVMRETQNRQIPWEHSSMTGAFYFSPADQRASASALPPLQPAAPPPPVPAVEVGDFAMPPASDDELTWLKTKIERNFVDLFVENGVRTAHKASTLVVADAGATRLRGALERNAPDLVEIRASLEDGDGTIVASTSVEAGFEMLKANYKSIPAALVQSLGVSPQTLQKTESARRPTSSFPAMLLYLEAQRRAELRQLEKAAELLEQAQKEDPRFAAAFWAGGQVQRALGNDAPARAHEETAAHIDPDHIKTFRIGEASNPLPHLRAHLSATPWRTLGKGLSSKLGTLESYGISVYAWKLAPQRFRLAVVPSASPFGSTVAELRTEHKAILAINGGFFDIDAQSRLTPSGLVIADGHLVAAATDRKKGGSGALYSRGGAVEIDLIENAKDVTGVSSAVQVGPLVVDPGGKNGIRRNDLDRQRRSAICRLADGTVAIVLVDGGLSLYELGELLSSSERDGGFGCERALNLDGGPSTQVSFAWAASNLEIPGQWKVANALLILPK